MPPIEPSGSKQDRRAAMLRGVYEDNRKVVNMPVYSFDGLRPPRRRAQRARWAGVAAGMAAIVLIVLAGFVYQNVQEKAEQNRTSSLETISNVSADGPFRQEIPFEQEMPLESETSLPPIGPLNTPRDRDVRALLSVPRVAGASVQPPGAYHRH